MLATNPIDKDILDRAMSIIEQHLDDTEFNVNVFEMCIRDRFYNKYRH